MGPPLPPRMVLPAPPDGRARLLLRPTDLLVDPYLALSAPKLLSQNFDDSL
jgi:hypothetical protein